jgi:thioredoxin 1
MGEVAEVNQGTFEDEVIKSELPTLVDFWAPWCGPCRMLSPIVDELAGQYTGKLKVVKVNTDQNNEIAGQFGIRGIPTLIFFKGGKEIDRVVGVQPKTALAEKIESAIKDGK